MNPSNTIFCSSCGTKLDSDAQFCDACGSPVIVPTAPTYIPPTQPPPVPVVQPVAQTTSAFIPTATPKRSPIRLVLSIGCGLFSCLLMMISLGILAGSLGGMDYVSQYLPEELTNMISFSGGAAEEASSPDVEPIQVENSPVPAAAPTTSAPVASSNSLVTGDMLPNLILTASEVPANWKIAKSETSGISNEDWAAGNDDAANILKVLNESGRLTNISYYYSAPGDACSQKDGAVKLLLTIDLFKDSKGAQKYYEWDSINGKVLTDVGESSSYTVTKYDTKYLTCDSKYNVYILQFKQRNTVAFLRMVALDGAYSDGAAESIMKKYGTFVDKKILVTVP